MDDSAAGASRGAQRRRARLALAIIGGGWAGLYALKHCLQQGLDAILLEKTDACSGLWVYRPGGGGVFANTIATASRGYMQASDFPFNENLPEFLGHKDYRLYLEQYVADSNAVAASKTSQVIVLLKSLPLISFSLMQMQPEDATIAVTMMEVMASVARGVAVRSVGETVAGLLVPLMRAYGEAFDAFQKSATVAIPVLGEVWAKERLESAVTAFMASVGAAEAAPSSVSLAPGGAAQPEAVTALEKKLREANKRLDKLDKAQRGLKASMSEGSDEEEGEASEKTLANRAKRKAKREAKERKAKAASANARAAP